MFNAQGEVLSFTTEERAHIETDGQITYIPWTAKFLEYEDTDGLHQPTRFQAIWHYENGEDSMYFDGKIKEIHFY